MWREYRWFLKEIYGEGKTTFEETKSYIGKKNKHEAIVHRNNLQSYRGDQCTDKPWISLSRRWHGQVTSNLIEVTIVSSTNRFPSWKLTCQHHIFYNINRIKSYLQPVPSTLSSFFCAGRAPAQHKPAQHTDHDTCAHHWAQVHSLQIHAIWSLNNILWLHCFEQESIATSTTFANSKFLLVCYLAGFHDRVPASFLSLSTDWALRDGPSFDFQNFNGLLVDHRPMIHMASDLWAHLAPLAWGVNLEIIIGDDGYHKLTCWTVMWWEVKRCN